jgi:hypothetical protein
VRRLAISSHRRTVFPELERDRAFDVYHLRYNAAHRGAETEVFPFLPGGAQQGPGVVAYTATRWASLLDPRAMPPGEPTPTSADCYRFVLSNPHVQLCMTGPRNRNDVRLALTALARGPMDEEELGWMRRVGDHVRRRGLANTDGPRARRRAA